MRYPFNDGDYIVGRELKSTLEQFKHELLSSVAKRLIIADIEALTANQIVALSCGDCIVEDKDGIKKAFTVAHKAEAELNLVYADHTLVQEVCYKIYHDEWTLMYNESTELNSEPVPPEPGGGEVDPETGTAEFGSETVVEPVDPEQPGVRVLAVGEDCTVTDSTLNLGNVEDGALSI